MHQVSKEEAIACGLSVCKPTKLPDERVRKNGIDPEVFRDLLATDLLRAGWSPRVVGLLFGCDVSAIGQDMSWDDIKAWRTKLASELRGLGVTTRQLATIFSCAQSTACAWTEADSG